MIKMLNNFSGTWLDYPDNESYAVLVCMIGCDNCCKGCQNAQLKDYNYKINVKTYEDEEFYKEMKQYATENMTNKVVLQGGDPLSSFNIKATKHLLEINNKQEEPLDICIYTGHSVEYAQKNEVQGFKFIKCGHFNLTTARESYKTDDELVLASPNQEFYDSDYNKISENGILRFK